MHNYALSFGGIALPVGGAFGLATGAASPIGAAAVALLGLVLLAGRVWLSDWRPSMPSRASARRVGVPVVALLVVSTAALSGVGGEFAATQTASAEMVNCDWSPDEFMGIAVVNTLTGNTDGCHWSGGDETDYENQTQTDFYEQSLTMFETQESHLTSQSNFAQDTRKVAYTKAKIEVIQSLNNGTSESVAQSRVKQEVRDYYSQLQLQLLKQWNQSAYQLLYMTNSSNPGTFQANATHKSSSAKFNLTESTLSAKTTKTMTLANGSTANYVWLQWEDPNDTINAAAWSPDNASVSNLPYHFEVINPDTGEDRRVFPRGPNGVSALFWEFNDQSEQVTANMDSVVSGYYTEWQQGDINATDLAEISPHAISTDATTSYNSTGYYGYAAASLASIGAAGDLNASHTVSVYDSNGSHVTNYTGTLFYTGDDVRNFSTGERYNLSNVEDPANTSHLNGTVYFVVQPDDSNKSAYWRPLSEDGTTFEIVEATNTNTGESVETTRTQQFVYETTDPSDLREEIQRLERLREEYETMDSSTGGGGFDLGGTSTGAIGALLAVVVILIATRD